VGDPVSAVHDPIAPQRAPTMMMIMMMMMMTMMITMRTPPTTTTSTTAKPPTEVEGGAAGRQVGHPISTVHDPIHPHRVAHQRAREAGVAHPDKQGIPLGVRGGDPCRI
jgi:hypothetical protein